MFIPVSILTGGQESMFKNRIISIAPICKLANMLKDGRHKCSKYGCKQLIQEGIVSKDSWRYFFTYESTSLPISDYGIIAFRFF